MAARTDNVTDPGLLAQLLVARRGQAYYSRKLSELSDDDLDAPSRLEGWDRRHLVAHVGLNARALTHLTEWALTGIETPMYGSPTQRQEEIDFAATLPAQALRNLSDHAAIHLNVEWRDLPEHAWSNTVRTAQGREVAVSETVWMRTREVWIHAVDLDNGGSFNDFPPKLIDSILLDVLASWRKRRDGEKLPTYVLELIDREGVLNSEDAHQDSTLIRGLAADLASWATGRSNGAELFADRNSVLKAPRWL
jgi:maleylpyruvate isomerase